jgi:hypothetical protein
LSQPLRDFGWLPLAIQAAGGAVVSLACLRALGQLAFGGGAAQARLSVAQGGVLALSLMLPATILRSLVLRDRSQLVAFALVLGLRLLVKRTFAWESARVGKRHSW